MMRRYSTGFAGSGVRFGPGNLRGFIRTLIIINVSIWIFEFIFGIEALFNQIFGLVPLLAWKHLFIWQPFTYLFLHGSFFHVLINMFVLWMFGSEIEALWGTKKFMKYYFITGVGAGIITILFTPNSQIPVVGASGAIYGVLLAFALIYPNRLIYLYFLFPIQAKYFALLMGFIEFISTIQHSGGHISNITHLSGLIIGYIYLRRYSIRDKLRSFIRIEKTPSQKDFKADMRIHKKSSLNGGSEEEMKKKVDELLDKISDVGFDNLSDEEKETLFRASAYFSDKQSKKE